MKFGNFCGSLASVTEGMVNILPNGNGLTFQYLLRYSGLNLSLTNLICLQNFHPNINALLNTLATLHGAHLRLSMIISLVFTL